MARQYDLTIFGATGFTGALTAIALARLLVERHPSLPSSSALRVAVAGRSAARLSALLKRVADEVVGFDSTEFGIVIADVSDAASLRAMAAGSKVLLSAAGPYRLLGEPVFAACVEERTHYLDVTGEPYFMEKMALKYGAEAAQRGVLAVSSCGFDSIPADLGVVFAVDALRRANCFATEVESFLTIKTGPAGFGAHFATYESAVLGIGSTKELVDLRRSTREPRVPVFGTPAPKRPSVFRSPKAVGGLWALHFPGSDASVVRRSQRAIMNSSSSSDNDAVPLLPVQYGAYFTVSGYVSLAGTVIFGTLLRILSQWAWGRRLLLAAPGFFSGGIFTHRGPTPAQLAGTSFEMRFIVKGFAVGSPEAAEVLAGAGTSTKKPAPTHQIESIVGGAEPGYVATPLYFLGAAFTVIDEAATLPRGVLTPAAAFRSSSLIQRLTGMGLRFDITQGVRSLR